MTLLESSNLIGAVLRIRGGLTPWTPERVELLRTLWTDGQSASFIASKMDYPFTRSAILGKVNRLGLFGEASGKPHANWAAHITVGRRPDGFRRKALPKTPRAVRTPEITTVVERGEAACSFAQLGPGMCRYPFGEPGAPDFAFCGRPADGSYCRGHHAICYTPVPLRRERHQ